MSGFVPHPLLFAFRRALETHQPADEGVVRRVRSISVLASKKLVQPVLGGRQGTVRHRQAESSQARCPNGDQKRRDRFYVSTEILNTGLDDLVPRKRFERHARIISFRFSQCGTRAKMIGADLESPRQFLLRLRILAETQVAESCEIMRRGEPCARRLLPAART